MGELWGIESLRTRKYAAKLALRRMIIRDTIIAIIAMVAMEVFVVWGIL